MDDRERDIVRMQIRAWRVASPVLERDRSDRAESQKLPEILASFDDAFAAAQRLAPPRLSSGLVEQQRYFIRLAGRG